MQSPVMCSCCLSREHIAPHQSANWDVDDVALPEFRFNV